jgi:dihydropteroate synthase
MYLLVTKHHPVMKKINDIHQAEQIIKQIGCDPQSIPIMAPKMIHHVIQLDYIHLQDAIIIKQDMLSIGGEVCVPSHTFNLEGDPTSILISGTLQQFILLVKKLHRHYPRIKRISEEINQFIQPLI